jgi:hypothetical protein
LKTELTAARLRELLNYDSSTGEFTWCERRSSVPAGGTAGCLKDGYIVIRVDGVLYRAHRLAWLHVHGEWPKDQLDHVNHERADNRLTNLRQVDNRENARNTTLRVDNNSGRVGVSWASRDKRWKAQIGVVVDGRTKVVYLGNYRARQDAIAARSQAEIDYGFHENHGAAHA